MTPPIPRRVLPVLIACCFLIPSIVEAGASFCRFEFTSQSGQTRVSRVSAPRCNTNGNALAFTRKDGGHMNALITNSWGSLRPGTLCERAEKGLRAVLRASSISALNKKYGTEVVSGSHVLAMSYWGQGKVLFKSSCGSFRTKVRAWERCKNKCGSTRAEQSKREDQKVSCGRSKKVTCDDFNDWDMGDFMEEYYGLKKVDFEDQLGYWIEIGAELED